MRRAHHVAIVGGGITGLVSAYRLASLGEGTPVRVTLLEADGRLGGKVRTEDFAGRAVDAGAEALLTRNPEALALCRELGLEDDLVAPAREQAFVWTRDALRPLPPRMLSGMPGGLRAIRAAGVLSPLGIARAGLDLLLPSREPAQDISIGELVRRRLGREVFEQLVDPLLGVIHAGDCDQLSVRATAPALASAVASGHGLVRGLRAAGGQRSVRAHEPVSSAFVGLRGGLGDLVKALARELAASEVTEVRTGMRVRSLEQLADGRVTLGTDDRRTLRADCVVLAVPAFTAAELLARACPPAARELSAIRYASVATVLLAFPPDAISGPLNGSGFLVPRGEGRIMTACTWASAKWPQLAGAPLLLKASVGHVGDRRALDLADGELVARLRAELAEAMGISRHPLEARVVRFERALPQYGVGHLDRVARIERELSALPAVRLTGAAYRGVGVGACVRAGELTAAQIAAALPRPAAASRLAPEAG